MRMLNPILWSAAALFALSTAHAQDRAHELAGKAASQHSASCPKSGMTLQKCHANFPDGCSASAHPNYDAYLDFLKDQDPGTVASTKDLSAADFPKLESALPKTLQSANHGKLAADFAGLGEGNISLLLPISILRKTRAKERLPSPPTVKLVTAS